MSDVPAVAPLDDLLASINADHGYPALVAAVASRDRLLATGATGVRKAGGNDPVSVADRFHIGSITKPMTATLCATLFEEGRLAWDARPVDILPEFAAELHPVLRSVRLEHLLAHRAGIAPFTDDEEMAPVLAFEGTPHDRRLAFSGWLLRQEPVVTPDTEFSYSNAGYTIAAAMAERAGDVSWEDLMRSRLFAPLGLDGAGLGWPALDDPKQPWGHFKRGDSLEPQDPHGEYQLGPLHAAAGDVHMPVADLAAFGRMHPRGLAGKDILITADTVRRMHTPLGDAPGDGYGLGWSISESSHNHTGCAGTFLAVLLLRPQHGRVYAVATNAAAAQTLEGSEDDRELVTDVLSTLVQRFEA
jgi:CubicO group peptidase (beta-lactamase class C family)